MLGQKSRSFSHIQSDGRCFVYIWRHMYHFLHQLTCFGSDQYVGSIPAYISRKIRETVCVLDWVFHIERSNIGLYIECVCFELYIFWITTEAEVALLFHVTIELSGFMYTITYTSNYYGVLLGLMCDFSSKWTAMKRFIGAR